MANEVYGSITLDCSVKVESNKSELALLEANYNYNDLRFVDYEVIATDSRGNKHKLKLDVHNCEFEWVRFYKDDEVCENVSNVG